MSATAVLTPTEFESELRRYRFERMEEARAVRVGEKETSDRAAVVARYAHLFSREQLEALREATEQAGEGEKERLFRIALTCEGGLVSGELAEREDELENAILAARVSWRGDELPLRGAQAKLAVLPEYRDREELGEAQAKLSAGFNEHRLELLRASEDLQAEVSGIADPVERIEWEKGVSHRDLSRVLDEALERTTVPAQALRERWLSQLLGPERDAIPSSYHVAYVRRLSPLADTYTKERSVEVCVDTLARIGLDPREQPNIRLDLEDRPQKSPRACVIASDPPEVVHLITRAQGGVHDYAAFLHEAGHALHYAGVDRDLPFTFRAISRDHGLTEIYSYIVESISREPGWHERYFELSPEEAATNAEATAFVEGFLFRRYVAKLHFELEYWSAFDGGDGPAGERYEELLTAASGVRYRADGYLADMDSGFYSADYLRAWIRSAQLRAYLRRELGAGWWENAKTGDFLRECFREGTRPSSEEFAARIGFDPLDTSPLVAEQGG